MDTPHVSEDDGYAIIDRDDLWNEDVRQCGCCAPAKAVPGNRKRNHHPRGTR